MSTIIIPFLLERIAKSLGVEVYELFMFEEVDKRSARKAAIQALVHLFHDKSPDDIRFTASILRQVLESGKGIIINKSAPISVARMTASDSPASIDVFSAFTAS